jgi:hypothetical protein
LTEEAEKEAATDGALRPEVHENTERVLLDQGARVLWSYILPERNPAGK